MSQRHGVGWAGIAFACMLAGCGAKNHSDDPHGGSHAHADEPAPAAFKEGRGLQLAPETAKAIGVELAPVEERKLAARYEITASVFDAGPPARAVARVPSAVADEMEKSPPADVKILSVRRKSSPALEQAEIVLEPPGAPPLGATLRITLQSPERVMTVVPRAALLRSATGTYVYVENGGHLLRTAVRVGASADGFVEILDGLYAGDVVVAKAVEELWLTELRLTRGGGHSH